MRLVEAAVFLSVAAGAHVGLWSIAPVTQGANAAGDGGAQEVSAAAASARHAALAQTWDTAPTTATPIAMPTPAPPLQTAPRPARTAPAPAVQPVPVAPQNAARAPELPQIPVPVSPTRPQTFITAPETPDAGRLPPVSPLDPSTAQRAALPDSLAAAARPNDLPQIDLTTPGSTSKRPVLRPARLAPATLPKPRAAEPAARPAPKTAATPKKRAKGTPRKSTAAGSTGTARTQSVSSAQANALRAQWGARIQAKVRRATRYPSGATSSGRVKVALKVSTAGKLVSVGIARSSGDARLDRAAIAAVKRARRFARAPKGLTKSSYAFTLSIDFNR